MFQYGPSDMVAQMLDLPAIPLVWVAWLTFITYVAPLFFLRHRMARVVLGWMAASLVLAVVIWSSLGLVRLVSLAHLVFWTPALVYILRNRASTWKTPFEVWAHLAGASMAISLVLDAIEVARYALGDTGLVV